MDREIILQYLYKIIFLEIEGKLFYTCKILSVGEDSFTILDKFKIKSSFNNSNIKSINEIKDPKILDLFKSFEEDDANE